MYRDGAGGLTGYHRSMRHKLVQEVNSVVQSTAATVEEYLTELTEECRWAISEVRETVLAHLPDGYHETMQHGMISYVVPLETYPVTYNRLPLVYVGLASQKNYMSLYLMNIYAETGAEQWFVEGFKARGKRLNMGKSCVRFKKLDDLPIDLVGMAVARTSVAQFIELYEMSRRKS